MGKYFFLQISFLWLMIDKCSSSSSPIIPFTNYTHSVELHTNVADLWWMIDDVKKEITFELHMNTSGWIALGISPGKNI